MNDQDRKDLEADETEQQADRQAEPAGPEAAETGAETAETDAETAETGAETAETDAETAETGAETAETDAETAETDAETVETDAETEPPEPVRDTSHMKWYVVHTYSGFENKAKQALEERIKREGLDDEFGEILIPTEEVVEMSRGKRRTSRRKFFPGYMLVKMSISEASWYLVKSTPKITGFVGNSTRPQPVPEVEMRRLSSQIAEGSERLRPKVIFEKGDSVRVVDGPFSNFNGTIDDVDPDKGKLRVLVSIFGRATPVEMDFVHVERT